MAGLPWVAVEVSLFQHPKLFRLAAVAGVNRHEALGWLLRLWGWASTSLPCGEVQGVNAEALIEESCGLPAGAVGFFVASRWMDRKGESYRIHDWEDHQGARIAKATAERAKWRNNKRRSTGKGVVETSGIPRIDGEGEGEVDGEVERNDRSVVRSEQIQKFRRGIDSALARTRPTKTAAPNQNDPDKIARVSADLLAELERVGVEAAIAHCGPLAVDMAARGDPPQSLYVFLAPLRKLGRAGATPAKHVPTEMEQIRAEQAYYEKLEAEAKAKREAANA